MDEAEFLDNLCQAAGLDNLDLVNLNRASLVIRNRAIDGVLLYERDPDRVSDFFERTWLRYWDFKPLLDEYERQYRIAMDETYGF